MSEARYFRWDWANNEAVEYERSGECNNCGMCCKALIKFRATNQNEPRAGGEGSDCEGIDYEILLPDGRRRLFNNIEIDTVTSHQCPALSAENRCLHHFDKEMICKGWPFAPEHVTPFPECSYSFKEIQRWEIES